MHPGRPRAVLALADGTVFRGWGFGARGTAVGEVVFNTCMTGYQEILTDPSYHRQIVVMTPVQIGNTGVNSRDEESSRPWVSGFVVRESSRIFSNWRAGGGMESYLERHGIPGIEGIDTRALTRRIRDKGAQGGAIGVGDPDEKGLVEAARSWGSMVGKDLVREVTPEKEYTWTEGPFHPLRGTGPSGGKYHVVAVDYRIQRNILRELSGVGCRVTVVPAATGSERILGLKPDGVFLSNGPGDPEPLGYAVSTIRDLFGKVPIFGICLGHQILGLALGGRTCKLDFGHHGGNHPVRNLSTGRIEITSQNHGFVVDPESLLRAGQRVEVTHVNLNDQTVEGIRHLQFPAFSVQYHPEASPGPHDSGYLFEEFTRMMDEFSGK
ncbi:MAG: glutamine-hydrolyzing carbamoyl-phosphate synthase small subunit [Proteobacteria bacterium]|nr:glutamine-hydrolyzing carbamoyl-phosphate synthase small subunit [Pseudomonadota bacterium]